MTIQVTEEMEDAYVAAAYASHEQVTASVTAGLAAVLAIVERDHPEIQRQHEEEQMEWSAMRQSEIEPGEAF